MIKIKRNNLVNGRRVNPYTGQPVATGAINNIYPEALLIPNPSSYGKVATGLGISAGKKIAVKTASLADKANSTIDKVNNTIENTAKHIVKTGTKKLVDKLPKEAQAPTKKVIKTVVNAATTDEARKMYPGIVANRKRLACGGKRPKAFIGAIIGAVGSIASGVIGGIAKRKQAKAEARRLQEEKDIKQGQAMTQAYSTADELQNEYENKYKVEYKNGGKDKVDPVITEGGKAIPIDKDKFILRGRSHKNGGIVIGKGKNVIEAENNEVIQKTGKDLKIFSAEPLDDSKSPAEKVLTNPNKANEIFKKQEDFKNEVGLNDDGTMKRNSLINKKSTVTSKKSLRNARRLAEKAANGYSDTTNTINQPNNKKAMAGSKMDNQKDLSSLIIPKISDLDNNDKRQTPVEVRKRKAAAGMKLTAGDAIGGGIGALGSIIGGVSSMIGLNKIKAPSAPILANPAKLKTTYNVNPQISEIERSRQRMLEDTGRNTASSVANLARRTKINVDSVDAQNQIYGQKENIETELINQDKLNTQQVRAKNADSLNEYNSKVNQFNNEKQIAKTNAINSMVSGVFNSASDMITQGQQRYEDEQNTAAFIASHEKSTPAMLHQAGYNFSKSQLNSLYKNAGNKDLRDYWKRALNKNGNEIGYRKQGKLNAPIKPKFSLADLPNKI